MGRPGNLDPRTFWQADLDEAAGRLTWLVRRYQPDVDHDLQRLRRLRPSRPHPDPRRRGPGVRAGRRPGLVSGAAGPEQAGRPGATAASRRGRRRSSTSRRSRPRCARRCASGSRRVGEKTFWEPPEDATPEQLAEFEAYAAKMLVPDEQITTWVDISGDPLDAQVGRDPRARDPDQRRQPVHALRHGRLARAWSKEAYILRESRVATRLPETDLFAGLA